MGAVSRGAARAAAGCWLRSGLVQSLARGLSVIEQWALVDQELEDGVRSVAVPLHDRTGRVIAAMNVSAHATRSSRAQLQKQILPQLQDAAAAIDDALRLR
ncbi:MAG: hypothetical protein E6J91_23755 [Deltaproteobacteria bacterium]|nr:MAG: hypothetical protein E6J91_23755 [Deltaproteobacteria bacterium]